MKAIAAIGIIMVVLGFISNALGMSPIGSVAASDPITEETPFSKAVVDQTAGKLTAVYTGIIEDMVSFADNPDLALATARRDEMTAYAAALAGQLDAFASELEGRLGDITSAPATPTGLAASGGDGLLTLDWDDNTEPDLDSYNVYRAESSGGPYWVRAVVTTSTFADEAVTNGTTYYYIVTAVNTNSVESGASDEVSATPQAPGA